MTPTEKKLNDMLRMVSESGPQEAPVHVEQALRAVFRRQQSRRRTTRWVWISGAAAALAAGVAAVALLLPVAPVVSPLPGGTQARVVPAVIQPVPVSSPSPLRKGRSRRAARQTLEKSASQDTAEFFALPGADSMIPLDHATVVRVQMPFAAFREIGLAVNEQRAADRVQADVLLAQDGSARAIRFVQ